MKPSVKAKGTVQSVERTLSILECFTKEKSELELGDIAKMTALSKSTVFRLLATLAQFGYIKQDSDTRKYSLGFKFFHLSAVVITNMNLRKTALPFMEELSGKISETIILNVIEDAERICVEVVESLEVVRNIVRVGQRNKLHEGSSGKVMLAFLPVVQRDSIIDETIRKGLLPMPRSEFENILAEIRRQGYVLSTDSRVLGAFSSAAPIFDYTGELVGCLTVAGPLQRLTEERIPVLIQGVITTAQKISEALGFKDS